MHLEVSLGACSEVSKDSVSCPCLDPSALQFLPMLRHERSAVPVVLPFLHHHGRQVN